MKKSINAFVTGLYLLGLMASTASTATYGKAGQSDKSLAGIKRYIKYTGIATFTLGAGIYIARSTNPETVTTLCTEKNAAYIQNKMVQGTIGSIGLLTFLSLGESLMNFVPRIITQASDATHNFITDKKRLITYAGVTTAFVTGALCAQACAATTPDYTLSTGIATLQASIKNIPPKTLYAGLGGLWACSELLHQMTNESSSHHVDRA